MNNFHAQSVEEVLRKLNTTQAGLSGEEARARLARYGKNEFPKPKKPSPFTALLGEFKSTFVYVLIAAAILSFFSGKRTDAAIIAAIVVANAAIGFAQRRKAEHAIEALENMLVDTANIWRDGELVIVPIEEIVPGDMMALEEGDRIPADGRVVSEINLRTDESALTGESFPEDKDVEPLPADTPLADHTNIVFMGTIVVAGKGIAVAVSTGTQTAFGQIALDIRRIARPKTHFEKRLSQLALHMGIFAFAGAVITFAVGLLLRGIDFLEIFVFSIAALVAGVPEGLPAVVTIVLASGVWRMARKAAIVRRLAAVETLGVATVILTDKTGTLTQNMMTVESIALSDGRVFTVSGAGWDPHGEFFESGKTVEPRDIPELWNVLEVGTVVNAAKLVKRAEVYEPVGDPTEVALIVAGEKAGSNAARSMQDAYRVIAELPFTHDRGFRAALLEDVKSHTRFIGAVGAWERLAACCMVPTEKSALRTLEQRVTEFSERAMRVLAVGCEMVPADTAAIGDEHVKNLMLLGVVGMRDPLRPETKDAIARTHEAGIRVVMQTGDHPLTALAIAKEAGIVPMHGTLAHDVRTESQLMELSDVIFEQTVRSIQVFARITPKIKLRIVQALQRHGGVVAVTGDGVNDAPALKQADIGIAMGKHGTDVAREASEIVLADDNFASLVHAIEEGRVVFANVRKTAFYLLTTNVAEAVTIVATMLFGFPLPLLPIHVLWLNLVTDGLPVVALALEPGEEHVLREKPRKASEPILTKSVAPPLVFTALLMSVGSILLFKYSLSDGIEKARTVAFTAMALFQLLNALNMRSLTRSLFHKAAHSGILWKALAGAFLLQAMTLAIPSLRNLFHFELLTAYEWLLIVGVAASILVFGELYKLVLRRQRMLHA